MIKQLLAGLAVVGLMSGVAFAQTYIPVSPPPSASPAVGVPGSTTTTTTVSPTTDHTTTITKCVDANGNGNFGAANSAERLAECASVTQKDVFVEVDFMQFHRPDPTAIANVVNAFANAPSPTANQLAYPGPIRLHVQIDEQIPHNNATALIPCTPAPAAGDASFDSLKTQFFGTRDERLKANGTNAKALASQRDGAQAVRCPSR